MKTHRAFIVTWACVLLLSGCKLLGFAPAQSFQEKLAYAYATHSAVLEATTAALQSGNITVTDAQTVLKLSDQARALLDGAKTVYANNEADASNKLLLAASILTQVQNFLRSTRP